MFFPRSIRLTISLYLAQIVNLVFGWLIAKLNTSYLSVSEYGQFSFFITVINILYVFFTFGIFESSSRSIAVSNSPQKYRQLLAATIGMALISYLFFTIIFWFSHFFIDSLFEVKVGFLIKVFFPLAGVYLFSNMWQMVLRGAGKIHQLVIFLITPRMLYLISLFFLSFTGNYSLKGSAFLNLLSLLLVTIIFIFSEKPLFTRFAQSLSILWREIRNFGIHLYWSEIIKVFLYHTDKIFISFFIDAEQLAYYALAYTITFPISFFSTAHSTILYKKFTTSRKISRSTLTINFFWIILSVLIMLLFKKWIILNLFSEKYLQSLNVFSFLAIAFGIAGLSRIFNFFLTAQGAGNAIRNISVSVLLVHLGLNIVLIPRLGIQGAAISILVTYLFDLVISLYYYLKKKKK